MTEEEIERRAQASYDAQQAYVAEQIARKAAALGITVEEYQRQIADAKAAKVIAEIAAAYAREEQIAIHAVHESGVPARVLAAVESARMTDAILATFRPEPFLVLAGGTGRGKSVAACLRMIMSQISSDRDRWGSPWRWLRAPELTRDFAYDTKGIQKLIDAEYLVIDDLGTEYLDDKGRALATICEVLETRFDNSGATTITTNLSPEAFSARYGERLVSRLRLDGAFVVIGGPDLRSHPKENH